MRQLLGPTLFDARLSPEQQELVRADNSVLLAQQELQRAAATGRPF